MFWYCLGEIDVCHILGLKRINRLGVVAILKTVEEVQHFSFKYCIINLQTLIPLLINLYVNTQVPKEQSTISLTTWDRSGKCD